MDNRLIQLAELNLLFDRAFLWRWFLRAMLVIFLILTLIGGISESQRTLVFGLFFIALPLGIVFDVMRLFLRYEIGQAELASGPYAITYATAELLVQSRKNSRRLWFLLLRTSAVQFTLSRLGVSAEDVRQLPESIPAIAEWVAQAKQLAQGKHESLRPEHLFEVIQRQTAFQQYWHNLTISDQDRQSVWDWYNRVESEAQRTRRGFVDTLRMSGGVGRDWTSGYTHVLDQYAFDITRELQARSQRISLVGHADERAKIVEYLARERNHNVIIIGEEGIGKERIILTLASDFNSGKVPLNLKYKHFYLLDTGKVVTGATQNEIEQVLNAVLREATTVGNVILVIPRLDLLIGAQGSDKLGVIDASAILATAFESSAIQIVGTITPAAYYQFVKPNSTLNQSLLPVNVHELQAADALRVLQDEVFRYETKNRCYFTYAALEQLVVIADQRIHDHPFPEKALTLLDEIAGAMRSTTLRFVMPQDVNRIAGEKLKIPMSEATVAERAALNTLESSIQQHVVGQQEAVRTVANALRRARAGLTSGKRPIGSFLFLGPTGVGKTEMAKTIAALYYKNKKAFIRLDMSEYQTPESLEKLVGTRTAPGVLTTGVTDQPFSVVLLDEIEKAAPAVRNLFLQILDDGRVTDGYGQTVDFTNTMVIATSNAGAELIRQAVKDGSVPPDFKDQLINHLQGDGIFAPEWLNRFDAVVVFLPLTREEIKAIAKLQIAELIAQLKGNNIELSLADDVYDYLVERGYDPQFGARPMRRAVQDTIENALARELLNTTEDGVKKIHLTQQTLQQ